jgi:hypothetical protein
MTLSLAQAYTITNMLKPFHADDKFPGTHTYGDMWQAYPEHLRNNCVTETDLEPHAGHFYCGTDRNALGESVMVFQRSLLEAYIKSLEPAPTAKVQKWYDDNGEHECAADAEIAERIAKLREAHKRNDEAVAAEYRRNCDKVKKPNGDSWGEMVKEENAVVEGLGDRDELHHREQAKKLRKRNK